MDLQTFIDIDRMLLAKLNGSNSLFLDQFFVTLTSPYTWIHYTLYFYIWS